MIILNLMVAQVLALAVKHWRWAQWKSDIASPAARPEVTRPWLAYCIAGMAAAVCGLLISLFFRAIHLHSWGQAYAVLHQRWAWAILVFAVAGSTAYLADNWHTRWPRHVEGFVQAAVCVVAMVFVQAGLAAYDHGREHTAALVITNFAVAGIVGFIFGYFVPSAYRQCSVHCSEDVASHHDAVLI
jgi:hypothetical protein